MTRFKIFIYVFNTELFSLDFLGACLSVTRIYWRSGTELLFWTSPAHLLDGTWTWKLRKELLSSVRVCFSWHRHLYDYETAWNRIGKCISKKRQLRRNWNNPIPWIPGTIPVNLKSKAILEYQLCTVRQFCNYGII